MTDQTTMMTEQKLQTLTAEERKLIEDLAHVDGIKPTDFTPQEIHRIIDQARFIGDLIECCK